MQSLMKSTQIAAVIKFLLRNPTSDESFATICVPPVFPQDVSPRDATLMAFAAVNFYKRPKKVWGDRTKEERHVVKEQCLTLRKAYARSVLSILNSK